MMMRVAFVSALSAVLITGAVRADDCREEAPEDNVVRRAQAKKWFAKGQTAADAGDDVTALKAYQCSLKFVPHGFTAYNLAQIAERIGDLEIAIAGYNQYLLLIPDAKDTQEVKDRLATLRQRLEKARQPDIVVDKATAPPPATAVPVRQPPPKAAETESTTESVTAVSHSNGYRTAAWIVYGGAGAVLVGGLVTNLLARSKMESCRTTYQKEGSQPAAEGDCNSAKSLAYTSYALFGVGAAAAVVGTVLILRPTESSDVSVRLSPDGGLRLAWSGRFR